MIKVTCIKNGMRREGYVNTISIAKQIVSIWEKNPNIKFPRWEMEH